MSGRRGSDEAAGWRQTHRRRFSSGFDPALLSVCPVFITNRPLVPCLTGKARAVCVCSGAKSWYNDTMLEHCGRRAARSDGAQICLAGGHSAAEWLCLPPFPHSAGSGRLPGCARRCARCVPARTDRSPGQRSQGRETLRSCNFYRGVGLPVFLGDCPHPVPNPKGVCL